MRVFVVDKFPTNKPRSLVFHPAFRLVAARVAKRLRRELASDDVVICCPFFAATLQAGNARIILWDELRLEATCQKEDLSEFHAFNDAAIRILEKNSASFVNGISVPRALSYGFIASHSEDLPFLISGIENILSTIRPQMIVQYAGGDQSRLVADVSNQLGIRAERRPSIALRLIQSIVKFDARFERLRCRRSLRRRLQARSGERLSHIPTDILLLMEKSRGIIYLKDVQESLGSDLSKMVTGIPPQDRDPGVPEGITDYFTPRELRELVAKHETRLTEVWRENKPRLAAIETKFRGVRIADYHLPEMERVWQERALKTALLADLSRPFLRRVKPRCILTVDPLETSFCLSEAARSLGIPIFLYFGIYDGLITTASLWERHLGYFDHVLVNSPWQGERIAQSPSLNKIPVDVVGDIGAKRISVTDREAQRSKVFKALRLDLHRKVVLVLLRPISSTFRKEERARMLENCHVYARKCGAQIIVKGHPYDDRHELESACTELGLAVPIVINEFKLPELLPAADLAVNTPASSTTLACIYAGVPAIIFGRRTLIQQMDQLSPYYAYCGSGAARCFGMEESFESEFRELLSSENAREQLRERSAAFVERIFGPTDGKSHQRIADFLVARAKSVLPSSAESR
jgi:hypothetical protein